MFASSTSISGLLQAALFPERLEVVHQLFFVCAGRYDHGIQFFPGDAQGIEIGLARIGPGGEIDAYG